MSFELWVVRHGETFDNLNQTLAKADGGKLTNQGIIQAGLTGNRLKAVNFDYVFVSDLTRTRETFDEIAKKSKFSLKNIAEYSSILREKWAGDA